MQFDMLDLSGTGYLKIEDFREVLQTLDRYQWTDDRVDLLFATMDSNTDRRIQMDEFVMWVYENSPSDQERLFLLPEEESQLRAALARKANNERGSAASSKAALEFALSAHDVQSEPQFDANVNVKVVGLSGETILDAAVAVHENIGSLAERVCETLSGEVRVTLFANERSLHASSSLKEAGVVNGEILTAVLKPGVTPQKLQNKNNCTAELSASGVVTASGPGFFGGDCSSVQDQLYDVQSIYSTDGAFAALKEDGSVLAWGAPGLGGSTQKVQDQLRSGVKLVCASDGEYGAFAALKDDGSVVHWGHKDVCAHYHLVLDDLRSDVVSLAPASTTGHNGCGFVARKTDGRVVLWSNLR